MNMRKVLAGGMAAVAAGATVAFGAFAQSSDLGAYVDNSGSTPVPPWIILGAGNGNAEYAKDVLGASDVAAGVAGFATRDRAIGGAAEISVSGGVSLSTANTKIFGGDAINVAKDTLTSDDLPSILASGTFEDSDGNTYDYDQYIVVGAKTVGLSLSNDDDVLGEDPAVLIDIGTNSGSPVYTLRVIFNDPLNFSSSDVGSNTIELFGTEYTISSDSDADTLILFGGANKQTLTEGETATVDVGGVSYEVSLIGVSNGDTVIVQVDTVSRTIDEGNSRKIEGLEVYVEEVYYLSKESQTSSAKLSFGSSRLTFDDADEVAVGSTDVENIDNTLVGFTQTETEGTSVLEIAVAAPDSEGDFAAVDMPFTDPVFGTFKVAFGGGTPAQADMAQFEFDTSSDDTATAKFTDDGGVSKTIEFGYDSAPSADNDAITLADSDGDAIIVVEGQNITEDQYVIINQDDFSHLLEFTSTDADSGDTSPTITFKDVFSGTSYEIILTEYGSTGFFNGTKVIDGKTYYFGFDSAPSTEVACITWGASASTGAAGAAVGDVMSVFPTLIAEKGAEVAFLNNVTTTIPVDLGTKTLELMGIEVANPANGTNTITGTGIQYTYNNITAGSAWIELEGISAAAVGILEEEGEDTSSNDVQNIVIVEAGDNADGITIETGTGKPIFSDAAVVQDLGTADSDTDVAADRYGVFVSENTDSSDQGEIDIYYPDNQVVMAVGIGSSPVFSVSGESGTVQEAYQITTPIAKLANEVTGASLTRDAIIFGGPCANALVADLMGVTMDWPDCYADFENLNEGMIQEYDDAFGSGQKALVIAGTTGANTRALAAKVLAGTMDYSA